MALTFEPDLVRDDKMSGVYCDSLSLEPFVSEFNEVCSKLKIHGTNVFNAKAIFLNVPQDAKVFRDTTITVPAGRVPRP